MKPQLAATFWSYTDLRQHDIPQKILASLSMREFFRSMEIKLEDVSTGRWKLFDPGMYSINVTESAELAAKANRRFSMHVQGTTPVAFELKLSSFAEVQVEQRRTMRPNMVTLSTDEDFVAANDSRVEEWVELCKMLYQFTHPVYANSHPLGDKNKLSPAPVDVFRLDYVVPGIFWLNFLSPELVRKAGGLEVLESLPNAKTEKLADGGALVRVPADWYRPNVVEDCLAIYMVRFRLHRLIGYPEAVPKNKIPALVEILHCNAEEVATEVQAATPPVSADFTFDSLAALDRYFSAAWCKRATQSGGLLNLVRVWGAYVGEVLVHNLDGAWFPQPNLLDSYVEAKGHRWQPFGAVFERFVRGDEAPLAKLKEAAML